MGIVVAANAIFTNQPAAKLAAPEDEGIIEQAAVPRR